MKFAEMFQWWNQAALENPMTAILSNEPNWDPSRFFETGRVWLDTHLAFAASANVTLEGRRAVDFGCGVGRMTEALARHYGHVTGVNISEEMVRLARQMRRSPNVEYVQLPEPPLPFDDRSVDLVYSTIVVQHIPFPVPTCNT